MEASAEYSSDMWIEVIKVSVPVLLAWVPFLILAKQIRQQNRTERAKVEVEYLRKILEVLDLPVRIIGQIQAQADETIIQNAEDEITLAEIKNRYRKMANDWDAALERHGTAVFIGMAFAKEQGNSDLGNALAQANRTAHQLGVSLIRALDPMLNLSSKDILPGAEMANRPEIQQAVAAWQQAALLTVKRIRQLYS